MAKCHPVRKPKILIIGEGLGGFSCNDLDMKFTNSFCCLKESLSEFDGLLYSTPHPNIAPTSLDSDLKVIKTLIQQFHGKPIAIWHYPGQFKEKEKWKVLVGLDKHTGSLHWETGYYQHRDEQYDLFEQFQTFFKEECFACDFKPAKH
jgi:hypothetical protein